MRQKTSTYIQFAKSREQLIKEEQDYFDQLKSRQKRTKIIATIGKKTCSYEVMREMYKAGANSFLINMAYISNQSMKSISEYREKLEYEFKERIPLTTVLKGSLTRIGDLVQPEILLKKGQIYRIIVKKQIVGDNCICSVDDEEMHKKIRPGDKLVIDNGQVSFTVQGLENSDKTLQILREEFEYDDDFQKPLDVRIYSKLPHVFSNNNDIRDETNDNSIDVLNNSEHFDNNIHNSGQQENQQDEQLNKYQEKFIKNQKKKKEKIYKVIVCQVDSDCSIKSFKPIHVYPKQQEEEEVEIQPLQSIKERKRSYQKPEEEEDSEYSSDGEANLTPKDINDISKCIDYKIDTICLTNVKCEDDVIDVKKSLQSVQNQIRVIAKIQNKDAINNFDKILKWVDGIVIARSYLVIHYPVEKLYFILKKLIKDCHSALKPVSVSCNILESMISTQLPTTTEVGEISNMVEQFIDGIVLSQETTVGEYPVQCVETLSRICMETEQDIFKRLFEYPQQRINMSIQSSNQQTIILNTIISCVIEAAYRVNASCVIAFSQTGSTIVKLSKMRVPCPILAIIPDLSLSRTINCLSSVKGRYFDIQKVKKEFEQAIPQIINNAKTAGIVHPGDFVIVTMFEDESKGSTNTMKILPVE